VRGLYDYAGSSEDDLVFYQGDIFPIIMKGEGGWWVGERDGACGRVPSNFVEEIKIARVQSVAPWTSIKTEDLSFDADEILFILDKDASGWWFARNIKGMSGWVPSNYMEEI